MERRVYANARRVGDRTKMRVANVFSGRPQAYDRNPLAISVDADLGLIGPHAITQRWSYTVPAARKFQATSVFGRCQRATAATTPGRALTTVLDAGTLFTAAIYTNVAGDKDSAALGTGPFYAAGLLVRGYTSDASTGGTMDYTNSLRGVEFDV